MVKKRYDIQDKQQQFVNEPTAEYGVTISVTIPTTGKYTVEALSRKLTEFALKLVKQNEDPKSSMSMEELDSKISRGEESIRNGKGISQMAGESNEAFFERLCTL